MSLHYLKVLAENFVPGMHRPPTPCILRSEFRQAWEQNLDDLEEAAPPIPPELKAEEAGDHTPADVGNISTRPGEVKSDSPPDQDDSCDRTSTECASDRQAEPVYTSPNQPSASTLTETDSTQPEYPEGPSCDLSHESPQDPKGAGEEKEQREEGHSSLSATNLAPLHPIHIAADKPAKLVPEAPSRPKPGEEAAINPRGLPQDPTGLTSGDQPSLISLGQPSVAPKLNSRLRDLALSSHGQAAHIPAAAKGPSAVQPPQVSKQESAALSTSKFWAQFQLSTEAASGANAEEPTATLTRQKAEVRNNQEQDPRAWWLSRLLAREAKYVQHPRAGKVLTHQEPSPGAELPRNVPGVPGPKASDRQRAVQLPLPGPVLGQEQATANPPGPASPPPPTGLSFQAGRPINDVAYRQSESSNFWSSSALLSWGDGEPLDVSDKTRFIQRVAQAFAGGVRRDGTIRFKLHPPELGTLRLQIRWKSGGLLARLEAENPEVCALLSEGLAALRQRLETQQIRVDKVEVVLANGSENPTDLTGGGQPPQPWSPWNDRPQVYAPARPIQSTETSVAPWIIDQHRVDVRI
ncbi:MAG: flagellar hook-length control protein FliK [Thermoguttaceae bacterium]|nr:flagellar hook-length control protein FliK [Thermoguttaceae bacterium]MDW8077456.1 flagellar hook-length control protein FliK [Thermoguttaceae bacterium]